MIPHVAQPRQSFPPHFLHSIHKDRESVANFDVKVGELHRHVEFLKARDRNHGQQLM